MNKHLVLVGMMGSGKTTVASWLHRHGGFPFYDTDHLIEKKEGKAIPDIFKESGEPYFRAQERRVTHELLAKTPGVIATGGGLFADPENRRLLLEQGIVFYLQASSDDLAARIRHTSNRPLLSNKQKTAATLAELLEKRDALYRQAHHVVSIAGRTTDAVASEIMELFKQSTAQRAEGPPQAVLGFLGAGKMARAVATGLATRGGQAVLRAFSSPFLATARTDKTRNLFVKSLPARRGKAVADNLALVKQSQIILIGVKPSEAAEVLSPLRAAAAGKLFLSLMAGIPLSKLQEWLGPEAKIVRCMPNTPALIGKGMTAYAVGEGVTEADLESVRLILEGCGKALRVEEKELNSVTSVSGSGPAYVYHFIDALIAGGIEQGLAPQVARELAVETVLGAAAMVAASDASPRELAAQVKSPNGTTVAGCGVLEKRGWETILREAVAAARARADVLGKEL